MDLSVLLISQIPFRFAACQGRGTDLNGCGLAVEAAVELRVDDQIEVKFTPPHSSEPVSFRSFVRNRSGNRYGLEFIAEKDADYVKMGELQDRLAAMAAGSDPSQ